MKTIFTISLIFFFASCETVPGRNWSHFYGKGLPEQDETYKNIYFVNEQTGYIGGSRLTLLDSKSEIIINYQTLAILYKTLNQGRYWEQIPLPFTGSVEKITTFGDTLLLKIKTENDTTFLVQSNNDGKDWTTLLTLTKHARIIDMEFINSTNGQLLTTDRQYEYFITYKNSQLDTLYIFKDDSPRAFLNDNIISLKSNPSTADYNSCILTNIKNGKIREIKFDDNYYISSSYKYNDNFYLAARKNNKGYILKLNETGYEIIKLGKFSSYLPDEILVSGNKLMAIGNKSNEVGPFGVIRSFIISLDGGKTWKKETLPSPMCISAPSIYKDKFFISAACPPGYLQIRRL